MQGTAQEYCPHECPNCGGPAYIPGGEREAKCIERACVFYDADTWVGWTMRLDDTGDPPVDCTEPDFFDEPTQPNAAHYGSYLDTYGAVLGKPRIAGESDDAYYTRLLSTWSMIP